MISRGTDGFSLHPLKFYWLTAEGLLGVCPGTALSPGEGMPGPQVWPWPLHPQPVPQCGLEGGEWHDLVFVGRLPHGRAMANSQGTLTLTAKNDSLSPNGVSKGVFLPSHTLGTL